MSYAHGKIVIICYHDGEQKMVEKFLDSRKKVCQNVRFYKIDTRESPDISEELAGD